MSKLILSIPLLVAALLSFKAFAENDAKATPSKAALLQEILLAHENKDFPVMLVKCQEYAKRMTHYDWAFYYLACAEARVGNKEDAFVDIWKAARFGFFQSKYMNEDPDLVSLHDDKRWGELQKSVAKNSPADSILGELNSLQAIPYIETDANMKADLELAYEKSSELIVLVPAGNSSTKFAIYLSRAMICSNLGRDSEALDNAELALAEATTVSSVVNVIQSRAFMDPQKLSERMKRLREYCNWRTDAASEKAFADRFARLLKSAEEKLTQLKNADAGSGPKQ